LEEGHLGGVGLDVYNHESELSVSLRNTRSSADDDVHATLKLAEHPRVLLTPHNAFNTREAVERKVSQSIQQITHFLEHDQFLWTVPVSSDD
jgi:D-lactate dehydrogenase